MATGSKISELTELTSLASQDMVPCVDAFTSTTKMFLLSTLTAFIGGAYQPLDSDLTAIAALATTSYGRAFLTMVAQANLTALLDAGTILAPRITGLVANAQVGTVYTLVLIDDGKLVTLSNVSAITLTIPANVSVAFQIGARVDIHQLNTGQVTVSPAGGVTLNSYTSLTNLAGRYAAGTLIKTAINTWSLIGNLA